MLRSLVLFFVFFSLGLPAALKAEDTCNISKSALVTASEIRGLKIKQKVPCLVHQKDQIKKYLLHSIDTKLPKSKLQMESATYRILGLIPHDFDYEKGIVDFYISQLGGYYDPEKDHFVMAGWMPALLQTTIAVHELTHALQDQYFDLDKFVDHKSFSGDQLLARSALVEGDATAVMTDYTRKLMGQSPLAEVKNVTSMLFNNVLGLAITQGGHDVPRALQLMVIFPYTSGLRFAHHLLQLGGYSKISEAYSRPPASTEEILHPEKYGRAGEFKNIKDMELAGGENVLYSDTLGEFVISTMLVAAPASQKKAASAAAGWGGDRLVLLGEKEPQKLIWKTSWDSTEDATEFLEAFSNALKSNYKVKGDLSAGVVSSTRNEKITLNTTDRDVTFYWEKL